MIKRYSIEGKALCIIDEELGLDINEVFNPKLIEHDEYFVPDHEGSLQWVKKDDEGKILMRASSLNKKFHGPLYYYFSNERLASATWFYHGMRIGLCEKYYPTGARYSSTQFSIKGEKMSFISWYDTGSVRSHIAYQEGRVHGTVKLYFPNGQYKRECECVLGQKEGRERIWGEKGELKEDAVFHQGLVKKVYQSELDGIHA